MNVLRPRRMPHPHLLLERRSELLFAPRQQLQIMASLSQHNKKGVLPER